MGARTGMTERRVRGGRASRERRGGDGPVGPLRRIGLAEVYNPSMLPTLHPGDQLVVRYGAPVRRGDVLVLRHPFQHDLLIVKRAVERRGGGWWVQGDNPRVVNDSREFGAVPDELVVARAYARVRPPRAVPPSVVARVRWLLQSVRPVSGSTGAGSGAVQWGRGVRSAAESLSRRFRAR